MGHCKTLGVGWVRVFAGEVAEARAKRWPDFRAQRVKNRLRGAGVVAESRARRPSEGRVEAIIKG